MTTLGSRLGGTSLREWPTENRSKANSMALVTPEEGGKVLQVGAAKGRSISPVPVVWVGGGGSAFPARTMATSIRADEERSF